MNKKSLVFSELLGLIIAVILVFFISSIFWKYCDIAEEQKYINSYNELVSTIENLAVSELEKRSKDLSMKFGSAIIAFPEESLKIDFKKTTGGVVGMGGAASTMEESIPKPEECEDKACICLCSDFKREKPDYKFVCKEKKCNIFDNLDFLDMKDMIGSDTSTAGFGWSSSLTDIQGGILITRIDKEPRLRTIYLQKIDNNIALCFQTICSFGGSGKASGGAGGTY